MIDEMLSANLIQPSQSSWSSPIYFVSKPDGSFRLTIDYRLLDNVTKKDAHPLPNIDDLFALLSKSKWFTKLDLFSGYFQIKLAPESRKYTAFLCERGLFEFVVMPMGLTNSPASFQRAMNEVMEEATKNRAKTHTNTDGLSRWPLPIDDEEVQAQQLQHVADETEPKLVINLIDITQNELEPQQLEITPVEQVKDQCIYWIKNLIRENDEKRPEIDQFSSNFHKRIYELYEQQCIENDLLFLKKENGNKLVVLPKHLMIQTIEKVHSSILGGHLGVSKTCDKLKERFYAPKLKKKTIRYIKECLTCQKVKQPKQ
ncbi:unnamed protein product [Brachionus calyciflorus]|uniref:Reverse transcriptase domain-containing protein n=1 Tax=Brachionus calyciflorus TaxID=104777 RepID=A0A813TZQ1_9BILA|nr:unnamed protein product [Brachionus calyciflorus]